MDVSEITVAGTKAFRIDNFYSNPGFIFDVINTTPPVKMNSDEYGNTTGFNGYEFLDLRHSRVVPRLKDVADSLIKEIGCIKYVEGDTDVDPTILKTNFMQWRNTEFNDYKNNFWFPHYDTDWTCIIYLNESETNGTNVYEPVDEEYVKDYLANGHEHINAWHPKDKFKLVDYLEPAFNRAYVFRAGKLLHSAAVDDETYFESNGMMRLNQVMFFYDDS